eukprot:GHRQ01027236.1.p1 GENE.GHRQ01027236.1~~GHRQ01027236.1.p1  ORF type:complete len:170 (-),score=42.64 GHRQ01027236.1:206-715(-)
MIACCSCCLMAPPQMEQLQIDRVIGLTPPNTGTVAHCPSHADLLAYPAGSFAVIYNTSSRHQLRLLRSTTSNAQLGCIAWSASGEQIAAGEAGANPSILVWDWSSSKCMAELNVHKHSIACVRFSQTDGGSIRKQGGAVFAGTMSACQQQAWYESLLQLLLWGLLLRVE